MTTIPGIEVTEDPAIFIHAPRPAFINDVSPELRYYGADRIDAICGRCRVRRTEGHASLCISYGAWTNVQFDAQVVMTAKQLRELARRCIDAAHDLDTVPAVEREAA